MSETTTKPAQPEPAALRMYVTLDASERYADVPTFEVCLGLPPECENGTWSGGPGCVHIGRLCQMAAHGLGSAFAANLPEPGVGYLEIPLGPPEMVTP